jgi:hypothetical protein
VRYLIWLQVRRRSAAQPPTDVIDAQRLAWRAARSLARVHRTALPTNGAEHTPALRVNPRRNVNIEEFTDANASRPISYVGTLVVYD